MEKIGIICEYNPFHNGHIYHINKIKEKYSDSIIVLVLGGNFTQRGDFSILDKWEKTDIALNYVDLVVELPFVFSVQSADIFAKGAIEILKALEVSKICFGTESLDIDDLHKIVDVQKTDSLKNDLKKYMDKGYNYPTSLSKAIYKKIKIKVENPNDLLGVSYMKALDRTNIEAFTIQRTNNYNDCNFSGKISSGQSIRTGLEKHLSVRDYVPEITYKYLEKKKLKNNEKYFNLLKYKIISEIDHLDIYLHVDEGIENRIAKKIYEVNSYKELIESVKTKRYTYNKINRMFICILCGFTKVDADKYRKPEYVRVLGFNKNGQKYLKNIDKKKDIPVITKYSNKYSMLSLEMKSSYIYYYKEKNQIALTLSEYKHKPIIK